MEKYTTVKIKRTTLERIRELADMNYRSVPQQIEAMVDEYIAKSRQAAYDLLLKESEEK
jgi:hypothetical protein